MFWKACTLDGRKISGGDPNDKYPDLTMNFQWNRYGTVRKRVRKARICKLRFMIWSGHYNVTEFMVCSESCFFLLGEFSKVPDHSNKHIQDAVRYAEGKGWTVTKAGGRAHIWGVLWCPERSREGCRIQIMSTPRNPESHARDIRRGIDQCPHS